MPYVYILQCRDNTLYTGYAIDLEKRLAEHREGRSCKYTRGRLPVQLVYQEKLPGKSEAMKRELQIKKLSKTQKQRLIDKLSE